MSTRGFYRHFIANMYSYPYLSLGCQQNIFSISILIVKNNFVWQYYYYYYFFFYYYFYLLLTIKSCGKLLIYTPYILIQLYIKLKTKLMKLTNPKFNIHQTKSILTFLPSFIHQINHHFLSSSPFSIHKNGFSK